MKINLLILYLITTTSFLSGQNHDFELPFPEQITKLKIKRDGFTITLDGKKGNLWASNSTNARKIAEEVIRMYKLIGGKERIRTSNLTTEIQIHAMIYISGKLFSVSYGKEIKTVWSDLTIPYSKNNIAKNIYSKLKYKLKYNVTQKDIELMIK
ncbi:MAG: hypothetical protein IMY67_06425 [Bacteroidetes bacterium]|nr:hypothetical protein [Bacteroidota bacterium]